MDFNASVFQRPPTQIFPPSQEELAHRVELDRTYISSLERQVYGASIDVVDRIAKALGVEAADLLQRKMPDR